MSVITAHDAAPSYTVATVTASAGLAASQWTMLDWLSAAGIAAGILGVAVRIYVDLSAHYDRKRGVERRDCMRDEEV